MRNKWLFAAIWAVVLAVLPSYVVERFTENLFLTSSPDFFTWSGLRLELFIISILSGAILAGYLNERLLVAGISYIAGIAVLISLFNVFCNQRVCYNAGIDGLEPLRMGYFLSCLAIVGIGAGNFRRRRLAPSDLSTLVFYASAIMATAYYPVIFTIAGARLLAPLDPVPLLTLIFLLSLAFGTRVSKSHGWKASLAVPFVSVVVMLAASFGIAAQYFSLEAPTILAIALASALGSGAGRMVHKRAPVFASRNLVESNLLPLVLVLFVIVMTFVVLPDVANGAAPDSVTDQSQSSQRVFPAYVGGFMANDFLRPKGVSVTVSFAGTTASTIQGDNFLAAGLGAHSPNCCVDGIDYGYRSDAFLYHNGSEVLVASAWRICDFNMACGGHSWQDLMFFSSQPLAAPMSSNLNLTLRWENKTVKWTYAVDRGPPAVFATFRAPDQENPYFNVGTLGNVLANPESAGTFFYQYGLMSRYSIGHGGWSVRFDCPSILSSNGSWTCIRHSESMQGDQSYWKALWRWGEPYQGVAARADSPAKSVSFYYSDSTLKNFVEFW